MDTLFLTAQERKVFDSLSADLKEGWKLQETVVPAPESAARRLLRIRLLRIHSPVIRDVQKKALACTKAEEFSALLSSVDFSSLSQDDLLELVFALGPDALSDILLQMLKTAKTDQGLLGVASLSFLRSELLAVSSS